MKLSNNYDWIVLGDHPGALLSACLAARLGLSVLVLPKGLTQRVIYSKSGQCLDPESNFISGIGEGGLLREALTRIGVTPAEGELMNDALVQVMTPELRIQLHRSAEVTEAELARELRAGSTERELIGSGLSSTESVLSYWRELPARLTIVLDQKGKKKPPKTAAPNWDDLLRKIQKKGKPIQSEVLVALAYGVSGQVTEQWNAPEWVHAMALGKCGSSFRGGVSAYRRMLLRSAKNLGATIMEDGDCRRIFVENRRFSGIQVSTSGNMVAGAGCILGSNFSEYADRMSFTGAKFLKWSRKVPRPVGWKFTIALTVREDAIMPGTSRRMVWKEPGAPVLEVEIADPAEYGSKEPDHKLVFIRTVLPFNSESLTVAYQRMIAARMFRLASELLPFLEYHITRVYPDFRAAPSEGKASELSEIYGYAMPQLIPENLRVYESQEKNAASGIEGLFISAGESFPKLGPLGPTVAAFEATAWLAHRSGLPGPLN